MKTSLKSLLTLCALPVLFVLLLLLIVSPVWGRVPSERESPPQDAQLLTRPAQGPVIFPSDPGWPAYAQREITVEPEPPILNQPTEICAWVLNTTANPQVVTLDFGIANFGIGLNFGPIGTRTIQVPPNAKARACVVWIPRQTGHWCIQAILRQADSHDQVSQRNIDIWESLTPGVEAYTVFPVLNSTGALTTVALSPKNILPGWNAYLTPPVLSNMGVNEVRPVTLTVVPPRTGLLGSRQPIVDVEARSNGGLGSLIGGFRKLDMPPVLLHRLKDPPYAETEISIFPYPTLPGEPTQICVDLRNLSNVPQTVNVGFMVADFGIGLPFEGIGEQSVNVPPLGHARPCVTWIPSHPGHFCVHVNLDDPQGHYAHQWSQRNLDVGEVLKPGEQSTLTFDVGNTAGPNNPNPVTADIFMTVTKYLPGWQVTLTPDVLRAMAPGEVRQVTLSVTPPAGVPMPEDGALVADVEAYLNDLPPRGTLLGGFRKIFHPPISIHPPHEPPYSESEINIVPYPPRAGEPVRICAELRNPTPLTQTVSVEFGVVNFGIGLPFAPIDLQQVQIPPFGKINVCTQWVPPIAGHFCAQIIVRQPGYQDVVSQRNMDVAEYLRPGISDTYPFPVGNPFDRPITVSLGLAPHLPGWQANLSSVNFSLAPHAQRVVTLTVTPPADLSDLVDEEPVLDVEAYYRDATHEWALLGGFRKLFRPPIPIHHPEDPPYAEREISIQPYPPRAGEPTEICVELRNPTDHEQTIWVEFAWANFGIGLPWHTFHGQLVTLPPFSLVKKCTTWVPPFAGHFCAQVSLIDPAQRYPVVRSQRNMDVEEIFVRGQWTRPYVFLVGNPFGNIANIELSAFVHLPGWEAQLNPTVLTGVAPGATRPVTLTVHVPSQGPLPSDDSPVVDVEAHTIGRGPNDPQGGRLIGGFRKIYRPPVPIHRPQDPVYAESEIHINPYPPREREPTEICVDVRNPTNVTQTITVTFAVANFGIGLPFHDIARPIPVTLPPNSIKRVCITWVPPFGGRFCARVTLQMGDHRPVWSQRNMDVGEILIPGVPSDLRFPVGNPTNNVATVTLGLVPHLDGWQVSLTRDVLPNMRPQETRVVTLTVIPPTGAPEPEDGAPVVDVEGFIGRDLIGGFRKIFHPPVPIHLPRDPVYAESEIFVDPYPTQPGLPTLIGTVVYNPTPVAQVVTVTFGVANFGIGLPFSTAGIVTPTMVLHIPPLGAVRAKTIWIPSFGGHFCVRVLLQSPGHEPVWSQRNMEVGEPLRLGQPHARLIPIGNPTTEIATVTLALVNHRPGWTVQITPAVLPNMLPGAVRTATLTVVPPPPSPDPVERERQIRGLADELPIVDVEAYVNGDLIGGIRKIAKPPVPLHKPQDRPYAETEIGVTPYPLVAGKPSTITTDIANTSETTQTVRVLFGVANFGMGIPFTTTGILPTYREVTLGPGISTTVWAVWTPPTSGHWCIQILLRDPNNQYPEQRSQRNVDVERQIFVPCHPFTKDFLLQNPTPLSVTVSIGVSAINLPAGWTYSTSITETTLAPFSSITVTVTITPPCGSAQSLLSPFAMLDTGGASGPPTLNVEGYTQEGSLLGGIQIQLELTPPKTIYLPIVLRH